MKVFVYTFIMLFSCSAILSAQLIKKDENIRLGVGITTLASSQIDKMFDEIEKETAKVGPGVEVPELSGNLTVFLEYESALDDDFSYLIYFQYNGNKMRTESIDHSNQIDQGLRFEYSIYEAGIALTYAIPIFNISTSQTSIILGAGVDLSFIETELFYYFDQRPLFVQTIEIQRNGGIIGGRFFVGWNIPYVESLSFQLRGGYDLRPKKKLPAKIDEFIRETIDQDREVMDPEVFESYDTFNFSQVWFTISVAYLF
jgi:hypothetical protein